MVCLIDPVGDVYACPFAIHENFLAGNVRDAGGFETVWKTSELFTDLRKPDTGGACKSCGFYDSCRGGCMAAKFFTGLPMDGPDPECVQGYGEAALTSLGASPAVAVPRPSVDHSHRTSPSSARLVAPDAGPGDDRPPPPAVPRLRREPPRGLRRPVDSPPGRGVSAATGRRGRAAARPILVRRRSPRPRRPACG